MAPDKEKVNKSFGAMRNMGIHADTVRPVLKRLLKLYNNWKFIEEDNYRALADAIFEAAEQKSDKNGNIVDNETSPPCKKLNKGLPENQELFILDSNKYTTNPEQGQHRNNSNGIKIADSSQTFSGASASEPDHFTCPAPTVKKEKDPVRLASSSAKQKSSTPTASKCPGLAINREMMHDEEPIKTDYPEGDTRIRVLSAPESSNSRGLVIGCKQPMTDNGKKRAVRQIHDITNGTEKVNISLLDETGNEDLPNYIYIPENIIYQSAYFHVSLARIADEDCCSGCKGDCLSFSIPCACARDTGGEFAYTPEGLLNQRFLESCITMKLFQKAEHLFFCHDCPLERGKNAYASGKCKGHLLRKFIKECWRKCGCSMQCGNRVVQRGITRKLQVFVSEGKGWGLRTLEDLPEGSFICEYAGEILTNIELHKRNKKNRGKAEHVYPVLLDADWATEGVLKDEDALCLDATDYGNVARFINHRCFDGNLIDIPVQVETPDRHYYHLAFFTKRKVKALEELTWDYGIDFDDHNHPIEAFQCSCGSQYCGDRRGSILSAFGMFLPI